MMQTIDPYIFAHASLRARLLVATAEFPAHMIDDARQELVIDCLRRAPKFDSTRGDWEGFVRGVMRNHATVLIKRRARTVQHEVQVADLGSSGDGEEFLGRDPTRELQLALDTQRVLGRLPAELQYLASMLVDTPTSEICAATGRSRSWVYERIRQLRDAFNQFGLGPVHSAARPTRKTVACLGSLEENVHALRRR